jgi:hypothetical protein
MDGLFGAVGSIVSATISSAAQQQALQTQLDAIAQQRQSLYTELNPSTVNSQAQAADVQRAQAQMALQGKIDPALLQARYAAESGIGAKLGDILNGASPSAQVAQAATSDALAGIPGSQDVQNKLIDAALTDIKSGATLPPDLQAQMVQSGLEQSGQATGAGRATGIGGTILRTVLGTAGINLQAQRQAQAASLSASAQNLQTQRQGILQQLFPNLQSQQLGQLSAAGSVFGTSQSAVPQAGLSGTDVANIWLARVGAQNQLTSQAGNLGAQSAMAQGQIWGNAVGAAARGLGGLAQQSGWFTPGGDTSGAGGVPANQSATLTPSDLTLIGG